MPVLFRLKLVHDPIDTFCPTATRQLHSLTIESFVSRFKEYVLGTIEIKPQDIIMNAESRPMLHHLPPNSTHTDLVLDRDLAHCTPGIIYGAVFNEKGSLQYPDSDLLKVLVKVNGGVVTDNHLGNYDVLAMTVSMAEELSFSLWESMTEEIKVSTNPRPCSYPCEAIVLKTEILFNNIGRRGRRAAVHETESYLDGSSSFLENAV
ncbi:hypothetical protein IW261DRAFT_1424531 [Armillaria novae-zelandiae]|uniref:Uncharacterized protein n=1 Tax=Armillaria novae-zelandiae TaxID=153914 RepID=A0AA39U194_9AGAR|nr:hypothetical protein IW261DRAFT_1424531 [Armillaria novae-zelandiae]